MAGLIETFGAWHLWGEQALATDYYVRDRRARGSRALSIALIDTPANPYLLRLQRRVYGDRRTWFVHSPFWARRLARLDRALFFAGPGAERVQYPIRYHGLAKEPGYALEAAITVKERTGARLRVGLPRGAPFVAVHAREAAFRPRANWNRYRDIDIATYEPAITWLLSCGLWIVRMGEPGVTPLAPRSQVIDYARSPMKAPDLDVILLAEAMWLIGCNSGLGVVAGMLGTESLWTNSIPLEMMPWANRTLWIPRMVTQDGRALTVAETIAIGAHRFHRAEDYTRAGLGWRENTPEEVLAATHDLIEGRRGPVPQMPLDCRAAGHAAPLAPSFPAFHPRYMGTALHPAAW